MPTPIEPGPPPEPATPALAVEDFRSLRRWLLLLGLLAVVATGVAAYALLRAEDSQRDSADQGRVTALERRLQRRIVEVDKRLARTGEEADVNRLERRLRRTGEGSDVTKLDRRLRRVENDVSDAVDGAADSGRALLRLDRRLDALSRDVRRLRSR